MVQCYILGHKAIYNYRILRSESILVMISTKVCSLSLNWVCVLLKLLKHDRCEHQQTWQVWTSTNMIRDELFDSCFWVIPDRENCHWPGQVQTVLMSLVDTLGQSWQKTQDCDKVLQVSTLETWVTEPHVYQMSELHSQSLPVFFTWELVEQRLESPQYNFTDLSLFSWNLSLEFLWVRVIFHPNSPKSILYIMWNVEVVSLTSHLNIFHKCSPCVCIIFFCIYNITMETNVFSIS